jgi:hypothetical protein
LENEKTMAEQNSVAKVSEEDMYAAALVEIQSGTARPGLWAKAFADSEGDENKSKALYIKLRVQQEIERIQQEQKAADALAAESVRRKAAAFQSVLDQLQLKGYEMKRTASGWAVREPLGGRVKHNSDQSLLEYAQRYGVHPLPPGEHPVASGRVAVAPELRDSFSSKSAERTDEKSGWPGKRASTRRPYEWGSVLTWTLTLLLWGMSTPLSASMRGSGGKFEAGNRFAIGVLWAVIGGIIVAVIKHFKRSPIPTSADAGAKAASIDKALFVASIVLAIFFVWKAIYLGTSGAFFDAAIVGGLGFGVKSGYAPARWLMAAYAFINPFIVIALGGVGNTMIWAFVFFAAARSIISHQDALNNGEPRQGQA